MIARNPVAWLTALVSVLTAVDGVLEGMHVLTPAESGIFAVVIAVLTAVLGALTHTLVTPLVDPKDATGRRLVRAPGRPA